MTRPRIRLVHRLEQGQDQDKNKTKTKQDQNKDQDQDQQDKDKDKNQYNQLYIEPSLESKPETITKKPISDKY